MKDLNYWMNEDESGEYLKPIGKWAKKGINIVRIFIVENKDKIREAASAIAKHLKAGIKIRVLFDH